MYIQSTDSSKQRLKRLPRRLQLLLPRRLLLLPRNARYPRGAESLGLASSSYPDVFNHARYPHGAERLGLDRRLQRVHDIRVQMMVLALWTLTYDRYFEEEDLMLMINICSRPLAHDQWPRTYVHPRRCASSDGAVLTHDDARVVRGVDPRRCASSDDAHSVVVGQRKCGSA